MSFRPVIPLVSSFILQSCPLTVLGPVVGASDAIEPRSSIACRVRSSSPARTVSSGRVIREDHQGFVT